MSEIRLFDILMVYLDKDWQLINKLCAILYQSISLEGGEKVSLCSDLLDIHNHTANRGGKLDFFELALERSNFAFLFFGHEPVDSWTKVYMDMVQMSAIMKRGITCVPVKLRLTSALPVRLEIYKPIELEHLLCRQPLENIDLKTFTADQLDQRLLNNITKYIIDGRAKRKQGSSAGVYAYNSQSAFNQIWTQESLLSSAAAPVTTPSAAASETPSSQRSNFKCTLQKNFTYLTNEVVPDDSGLITELYSAGVLNGRERAKVMESGTIYDIVEELLCLLLKKSEREFQKFLEALSLTGQRHVSEKLQESWSREIVTDL